MAPQSGAVHPCSGTIYSTSGAMKNSAPHRKQRGRKEGGEEEKEKERKRGPKRSADLRHADLRSGAVCETPGTGAVSAAPSCRSCFSVPDDTYRRRRSSPETNTVSAPDLCGRSNSAPECGAMALDPRIVRFNGATVLGM